MSEAEKVTDYMLKLEHPQKAEIESLREVIKNANSKITERVKWNAPSYYYKADMAAFNPRAKGFVQIIFVFPKEGMIKDTSGLLEGDWKDRRMAKFYDLEDIKSKKSALEKVVNDWVNSMEE
jgi:hypothetical protein